MSVFLSERLKTLKAYVPGEQPESGSRIIKLNTNESPFPPSPKAVEAGRRALDGLNLYSDPDARLLKSALAAELKLKPENISVFNGSDEALALIMTGFCDSGAVYNDVTYGFYKVIAGLFGIKSNVVQLNDDFTINAEAYGDKVGTVFIANPNAPTGIFLSVDKIEFIAAQRPDRLVVVDEAYVDFGGESAVSLIGRLRNVLVVRTFSKSRSLAGGRLGFVAANKEIIADLERIRNSFNPYNVDSVAISMGAAAVEDKEYFEKTRRSVEKNRAVLSRGLKKLGFFLTDSLANFVFASPPDGDGMRFKNLLQKKDILVRFWDEPRIRRFCRITVGSEADVYALLIAAAEIYGGGQ